IIVFLSNRVMDPGTDAWSRNPCTAGVIPVSRNLGGRFLIPMKSVSLNRDAIRAKDASRCDAARHAQGSLLAREPLPLAKLLQCSLRNPLIEEVAKLPGYRVKTLQAQQLV